MYIRTSNKNELYTNGTFYYGKVITKEERGADYKKNIEELLLSDNIMEPDKIISTLEIYCFASIIYTIPFILNVILLTLFVYKKIINIFNENKKFVLLLILADLVMVGVLYIITKYIISIPISIVPEKWSDFDFWSVHISEIKSIIKLMKCWDITQKVKMLFNTNMYLSILNIVLVLSFMKISTSINSDMDKVVESK
jgi:hypothetical protein